MSQKKYNTDVNGLPIGFETGGVPLYTEDLVAFQSNALNYNINAMLEGWSVVLSGCLVDEINVSTKTVKVTPGIVQLATDEGDICYNFPGYEGVYPFSIIPGSIIADDRPFKDGSVKNIGENYTHAIRTSFADTNDYGYPTDLRYDEILFRPFTDQRAESVILGLGRTRNEISQTWMSSDMRAYQTTLTDTNKTIVGGTIGLVTSVDNFHKYGAFGYMDWGKLHSDKKVLMNVGAGDFNSNPSGGQDSVQLNRGHIPRHHHESRSNGGSLDVDGPDRTTGNVTVQTNLFLPRQTIFYEPGSSSKVVHVPSDPSTTLHTTTEPGGHHHNIADATVEGRTGGGGENGLQDSPTEIDLRQKHLEVGSRIWIGYQGMFNFYKVRNSFKRGTVKRLF